MVVNEPSPAVLGLPPLHQVTLWTTWQWDVPVLIMVSAAALAYRIGTARLARDGNGIPRSRRASFYVGLALWAAVSMSFIGVYDDELFWARALQVIVLLMIVPFALAVGVPLTVLRESVRPASRARIDRVLASRAARVVTAPATTSLAILATPWLLYVTNWYPMMLGSAVVDQLSRLALVAIGFVYFYSRLQADPVPRKYHQMISFVITFVEVIFDAVLGLVLWLGPLRASEHYSEIARAWGPDMRTDQILGAGIIWILGDVIGIPFLIVLMRTMFNDDRATARIIDAELDAEEHTRSALHTTSPAAIDVTAPPEDTGLWWESDPQLSERFKRH